MKVLSSKKASLASHVMPCLCCAQVAGYVIITFSSVNAHVGKLAVRPECRRQGVASALMRVRVTGSCSPVPTITTKVTSTEKSAASVRINATMARSKSSCLTRGRGLDGPLDTLARAWDIHGWWLCSAWFHQEGPRRAGKECLHV